MLPKIGSKENISFSQSATRILTRTFAISEAAKECLKLIRQNENIKIFSDTQGALRSFQVFTTTLSIC